MTEKDTHSISWNKCLCAYSKFGPKGGALVGRRALIKKLSDYKRYKQVYFVPLLFKKERGRRVGTLTQGGHLFDILPKGWVLIRGRLLFDHGHLFKGGACLTIWP